MLDRQSPCPDQPVTLARSCSSGSVFPPELLEWHSQFSAGEGSVSGPKWQVEPCVRAETLLGPWHRDFLSTSLLVGEGSGELSRKGLTAQLGSVAA